MAVIQRFAVGDDLQDLRDMQDPVELLQRGALPH